MINSEKLVLITRFSIDAAAIADAIHYNRIMINELKKTITTIIGNE